MKKQYEDTVFIVRDVSKSWPSSPFSKAFIKHIPREREDFFAPCALPMGDKLHRRKMLLLCSDEQDIRIIASRYILKSFIGRDSMQTWETGPGQAKWAG